MLGLRSARLALNHRINIAQRRALFLNFAYARALQRCNVRHARVGALRFCRTMPHATDRFRSSLSLALSLSLSRLWRSAYYRKEKSVAGDIQIRVTSGSRLSIGRPLKLPPHVRENFSRVFKPRSRGPVLPRSRMRKRSFRQFNSRCRLGGGGGGGEGGEGGVKIKGVSSKCFAKLSADAD
jgi:hypothetical protein